MFSIIFVDRPYKNIHVIKIDDVKYETDANFLSNWKKWHKDYTILFHHENLHKYLIT